MIKLEHIINISSSLHTVLQTVRSEGGFKGVSDPVLFKFLFG